VSEILSLETNGWKLQRGYLLKPRYQVVSDERELGNVVSVAVASKPLRTYRLKYRAQARAAYEYVESFFNRLVGQAARFDFEIPEFVPSPDKGPGVEAVAGGTQGSRTIYAIYSWKNANGITRGSPAASIAVPANNLLKITLPYYPPSVTQAVIYATQGAAGTEQEQTILTNLKTWTQPDAPLLVLTSSPPSENTAKEKIVARMVDYEVTRLNGTVYDLALELAEAY